MSPDVDARPPHSPGRPGPAASSSATPCCGFGGLALASLLQEEAAQGRFNGIGPPGPEAARTCRPEGERRSFSCSWPAGRAHLETFDPKPLLNRLSGQPRPKEFGEAKYQFVQRDARLLGLEAGRFQKYGESGIEVSDLFPKMADVRRRPGRRPLLPRRHGRAFGRAVRAVHRPGRRRGSRASARGSSMGSGRRAGRCRPTW